MTEAPFKQEKAALSDGGQEARRPETAADGGDYAPQAMLVAAQNGEQEAMETLIQRNEGLIHGIARRFTDCLLYTSLDEKPAAVRKWTELENVRIYYDFFQTNRGDFSEF